MPKREKQKEKNLESELKGIPSDVKYIILWIAILAAVFLLSSYIFKNLGTVKYEGLSFTKEKVGAIPIYHYYYLYKDSTGQLVQNNIYLRTNPSENTIPIKGNITFIQGKTIYVGIDTDNLTSCNMSSVAIGTLSSFLVDGGLTIKGGTLNSSTAAKQNLTYVNCAVQNAALNPVILIHFGSQSSVNNRGLCYDITTASCSDLIPATEKFIVQSIVDAKTANYSAY